VWNFFGRKAMEQGPASRTCTGKAKTKSCISNETAGKLPGGRDRTEIVCKDNTNNLILRKKKVRIFQENHPGSAIRDRKQEFIREKLQKDPPNCQTEGLFARIIIRKGTSSEGNGKMNLKGNREVNMAFN
jgi:hypothetical protein